MLQSSLRTFVGGGARTKEQKKDRSPVKIKSKTQSSYQVSELYGIHVHEPG